MADTKTRLDRTAQKVDRFLRDFIRAQKGGDKDKVLELLTQAKKEGVSADAILNAAKAHIKDASDFGWFRSFLQGVSYGFSDEIEAFITDKLGGDDYDTALRKIRTGKAIYEGEYPMRAMGAEVAGALPSLFLPAGYVGKGAQLIGKGAQKVLPSMSRLGRAPTSGPTFLGQGAQATATAGVEGALGGAGRGETAAERSEMAMTEGLIGAASAPVLQGAVAGISKLGQLRQPVEQSAYQRIASRIRPSQEERIAQEVQKRVDIGDEMPETLADIAGTGAQEQVRGTRQGVRGEFDERVGEFIEERMVDAPERVSQEIGEFGKQLGVDVFEELDKETLEIIRAQAAREAYEPLRKAYKQVSITDAGFSTLFNDSMISREMYNKIKQDMERMAESGLIDPEDLKNIGEYDDLVEKLKVGDDVVAPFSFLEQATRELDAMASGAGAQRIGTTQTSYSSLASEAKDRLGQVVDGYDDARRVFEIRSNVIAANEIGKKAMGPSMTAKQVQKELDKLSPEAKQVFIQSALNNLIRGFDKEGVDYASQVIRSRSKKEKLKIMLGDQPDEVLQNTLERLAREKRMARAGREMTPRSDTTRNILETQEQGFNVFQAPLVRAQERLIEEIGKQLPSRRSAVSTAASEMLMETDPARQMQILKGVRAETPTQRGIEGAAVIGGRVARAPSLLSPIAGPEREGPVTIYTDEQLRRLGMTGLLGQ